MFLVSKINGCVPNLFFSRGICCTATCQNNHYITLGLTPNATQSDVKKAYFELCKKFHPDKNDGSNESTKKFRKITEAYEILGNEKSRRLYDQRMCYSGPIIQQASHQQQQENYNYEAERYFYERTNMRRRFTGKTAYYDFDAWTNAHYPKSSGGGYKQSKEYSRTWKKDSGSYSGHRRKSPTAIALNIMTFIIFAIIIVTITITGNIGFSISTNYGVDNDLANRKVEMNKSEPEDIESDKEKL